MVRGRLVLFVILVLAALAPASAAGQVMEWSSPHQLDPGSPSQFSSGSGIDCVGEQLCVATGGEGKALVSADPTGGSAAWEEVAIEEASGANLTSISCPSTSFCAAVDDAGHLLTSAEPDGGASWIAATIDPGQELVDISCSSASFCAAIDDAGNALVSDEPSGGAAAWESAQVLESGELRAISCPSASLCLAVHYELGVGGGLLVSSDPLAGASSWEESGVDLANSADDVSCPSETFCAIAYWKGVVVSNDPAGGAGAWRSSQAGEYMDGVSCPSESFCVGESYGGELRVSSDPAGEDPTWTEFDISPNWVNLLSGIDCTGDSFCAMVDQEGFVYTSTEPGAGPHAWRQLLTGEVEPSVDSPSCPTAGFCAVAGTLGRIYTSTDPTNPASWQAEAVTDGEVWSVSCTGPDWCVALGEGPTLLYSDEPGAGASAWSTVSRPEGRKISCPTPGFCAMLGKENEVLTSSEPLGGAATWTATDLELPDWRLGPNRLTQLSCPTADLCAVAGDVGTVLASEEPSGGRATWVKSFVGANDPYNNGAGPSVDGLDCTVASFCAATTWAGTVATTSDPLTGSAGWALSSAPATYFIGPISCADEVPLCVAVDSNGYAIASRKPGQLSSSWGTMEKIDGEEELNGISCASEGTLCVASDWDGRVLVGTLGEGEEEGNSSGGSGGGGPSPTPVPPSPPPKHHCKRTQKGNVKRMGISSARKLSNGGRRSKSRCARPR